MKVSSGAGETSCFKSTAKFAAENPSESPKTLPVPLSGGPGRVLSRWCRAEVGLPRPSVTNAVPGGADGERQRAAGSQARPTERAIFPGSNASVVPHPQGCIGRDKTSEVVPEAVGQAVEAGCQSGWGPLLSVTNGIEAGVCRQGDSGWA